MQAEKVNEMISNYEKLYAKRGGTTPSDPLQFHISHLARYWSRLVGFCRLNPSKPEQFIEGDLGVCVKVGSDFLHKLIESNPPISERWQDYWGRTQAMFNERPVSIEDVENASRAFDAFVTECNYDPWAR